MKKKNAKSPIKKKNAYGDFANEIASVLEESRHQSVKAVRRFVKNVIPL